MIFKPGQAEQIRQQAERSGQPVPERIANEPILDQHLEFFITSFWMLNTCRHTTEGPIPVTAIMQLSKFYDCCQSLSEELLDYVVMLDMLYLESQSRKRPKK